MLLNCENPSRPLMQPPYLRRVYEIGFSRGDNVMSHRISVVNCLLFDENGVPTSRSLPPSADRRMRATPRGPPRARMLL